MHDPLRYHSKNHCSVEGTFETCWRCGRDKATCRRKIRFTDWSEANEWVEWRNIERLWMPPYFACYSCGWCDGWHLRTATRYARKRMEKRARKRRVELAQRLHQQLANDLRRLHVNQASS